MTEENRDKIVRNSPFSCLPPAVQRERVRSVRLKSGAAQAGSPAAKKMLRDRRGRDFFQAVILYEIQKFSPAPHP